MDTRRLAGFIKVVDVGSVTRAASLLNIAQPALSQQIAALEAEFRHPLLLRSTRGVVPTAQGWVLYRHAQAILRQVEEARRSVQQAEAALTGHVSVGLAPFSTATLLAVPLLQAVRRLHPGIVLHVRDYFGTVLSELLINGRLQMAVLYGKGPIRGLSFEPLVDEEWFLVTAPGLLPRESEPLPLRALSALDLLLPTRGTFLRNTVEAACRQAGFEPRVVAEVESPLVMAEALAGGLGVTILPWSVASALSRDHRLAVHRLAPSGMTAPLSLCLANTQTLSPAAQAVADLLRAELARLLARWPAPGG